MRLEHIEAKKYLLIIVILLFLLVFVYVIPIAGALILVPRVPNDLVLSVAELGGIINPHNVSIAPRSGMQSLYFLFAPLAVWVFAIQLNRKELGNTLPLVVCIGILSGVVGILQLAGNADGPFYFYNITNNGSAVGLFANRNHAAVFLACMFPMLAMFATRLRSKQRYGLKTGTWVAIAISILLVPLVLVTGSRSGLLSAILGLIGSAVLYMTDQQLGSKARAGSTTLLLASLALLCLTFATIYFSRALAIERAFVDTGMLNDRSDFWNVSWQLFRSHFPFGFGPSGFVANFQIVEPQKMLSSASLNRLHNDWLETILTFGVPGVTFLFLGIIYYFYRSFVLWIRMDGERWAVVVGRMASVIVAILGIASITDYPLRTPAMAGFAALVLAWFTYAQAEPNHA